MYLSGLTAPYFSTTAVVSSHFSILQHPTDPIFSISPSVFGYNHARGLVAVEIIPRNISPPCRPSSQPGMLRRHTAWLHRGHGHYAFYKPPRTNTARMFSTPVRPFIRPHTTEHNMKMGSEVPCANTVVPNGRAQRHVALRADIVSDGGEGGPTGEMDLHVVLQDVGYESSYIHMYYEERFLSMSILYLWLIAYECSNSFEIGGLERFSTLSLVFVEYVIVTSLQQQKLISIIIVSRRWTLTRRFVCREFKAFSIILSQTTFQNLISLAGVAVLPPSKHNRSVGLCLHCGFDLMPTALCCGNWLVLHSSTWVLVLKQWYAFPVTNNH